MAEFNHIGQPVGAFVGDWLSRPRPTARPLQGCWCRLEPLDPARHGAELFASNSTDCGSRMWTSLPYGPFAEFATYASWLTRVANQGDPMFFAIIDESSQAVGVAAFQRIDPNAGSIEVGHLAFSPALQRRRAATEAMFVMMRTVFDELGYRRYEWKCDALNQASRRAAERLGFTYEGTFRQANVVKNRNRDTAWYSIIDSEWPPLRLALSQWLQRDNFDESGRQRRSLSEFASQRSGHP